MKKRNTSSFLFRYAVLFLLLSAGGFLYAQDTPLVIEGGTLIDGTGSDPVPMAAIVIENGRFREVATSGQRVSYPPGAKVIQAEGKYVLPGLIDAHVHLRGWDLELYPAHGVTTVVDTGSPTEWILLQREAVRRGRMKGPRILASGNILAGIPPAAERAFQKPHHTWVDSVEAAREATRRHIQAGVDLIKLYPNLSVDMLKAIIDEAHAAGLSVVGHVNTAWEAVEVGYDAMFHMGAVAGDLVKDSVTSRDQFDIHANMDFEKADALIQAMVSKGIYFNHLLRSGWNWAHREKFQHEDFDLLFNNIALRYIPLDYRLGILKEYNQVGLYWYQDLSEERRKVVWKAYENSLEFVRRFARAGGKLLTGSDTISTGGLSLHQALEILVKEVGVSPAEAILTVTKNPAARYGVTKDLGSVEPGKIADLIILSQNPLQDIRNTRSIETVIQEGKVLDISYNPNFVNLIPRPDPERTSHLFPSPVIGKLIPRVTREGSGDLEIQIQGTGFIPYSSVRFNGQPISSTFVDRFTLGAVIPADLLGQVGTYPIVVANPTGPTGTITAPGQTALAVLGVRDEESPAAYFMVGFK
ncbi:MAG: amidohydrolase family protein [Acidobacteriota bacterium]